VDSALGKGVGTASHGIPVDQSKLDGSQETVYGFDSFDEYPPSEDQLKKAYDAHT
jgi:hypothetical protein